MRRAITILLPDGTEHKSPPAPKPTLAAKREYAARLKTALDALEAAHESHKALGYHHPVFEDVIADVSTFTENAILTVEEAERCALTS